MWKYHVVSIDKEIGCLSLGEELNKWGYEGWELVNQYESGYYLNFIFKKAVK